MADSRQHERWIWEEPNHEHLYPIEAQGKGRRAICVIGPDTIHPVFGFVWWQSLPQKDLHAAKAARDSIVDQVYSEIRNSELTLAEAIDYVDHIHPFRCLGLCDTFESLCSLFDYWTSLGGSPYCVSDSDIFSLSDAIVTTYTPDYSDIWARTECDE